MYYVVEEPDSLHSDRSPYDFEPADTHTSLSSQVADYTQSGYNSQHTNSGDFVIKEHSYTMVQFMCLTCWLTVAQSPSYKFSYMTTHI